MHLFREILIHQKLWWIMWSLIFLFPLVSYHVQTDLIENMNFNKMHACAILRMFGLRKFGRKEQIAVTFYSRSVLRSRLYCVSRTIESTLHHRAPDWSQCVYYNVLPIDRDMFIIMCSRLTAFTLGTYEHEFDQFISNHSIPHNTFTISIIGDRC